MTQWARMVREASSTAFIDIDAKNDVFDKIFVSVVSSDDKRGMFLPVVAVDGAFSKHRRYGGVIIGLHALTPKFQCVTLAFGIVPSG